MNSFEITSLLLGSIKGFAREPPPSVGSWHTPKLERPWPMAASVYTCSAGRGPLPSSCSSFCRALSTPTARMLAFRNPRDLLADEPAAFMELLEAARPAPVSMEDMGAILRALPPEGEVTKLGAPAQQKVDAVRQLLKSTRRDWYEIKVIDLPQAGSSCMLAPWS